MINVAITETSIAAAATRASLVPMRAVMAAAAVATVIADAATRFRHAPVVPDVRYASWARLSRRVDSVSGTLRAWYKSLLGASFAGESMGEVGDGIGVKDERFALFASLVPHVVMCGHGFCDSIFTTFATPFWVPFLQLRAAILVARLACEFGCISTKVAVDFWVNWVETSDIAC